MDTIVTTFVAFSDQAVCVLWYASCVSRNPSTLKNNHGREQRVSLHPRCLWDCQNSQILHWGWWKNIGLVSNVYQGILLNPRWSFMWPFPTSADNLIAFSQPVKINLQSVTPLKIWFMVSSIRSTSFLRLLTFSRFSKMPAKTDFKELQLDS